MAPYMIIFVVYGFSGRDVFMLSFTYFNMLEFPRLVGWDNYSRLFLEDDVFLIAVKNTFLFAAITGPVSYFACFFSPGLSMSFRPKVRAFMTLFSTRHRFPATCSLFGSMIFSGDRTAI